MPDYGSGIRQAQGALIAALRAEQQASAFYQRLQEAYGALAPLPFLVGDSARRLAKLANGCARYGAARPVAQSSREVQIEGDWGADCRRACRGEAALAQTLLGLASEAGTQEVSTLLDKLARQSQQRRLPRLLKSLEAAVRIEAKHAAQGVPREEAHYRHGLISGFLENSFSILGVDHQVARYVEPIASRCSPRFLAGLAIGGGMIYLLKKNSRRQER